MAKMCRRIPKVLVIVVLVALIGNIDILFGCCMDTDIHACVSLQEHIHGSSYNILPNNQRRNSDIDIRGAGKTGGFLRSWKLNLLSVILMVLLFILGSAFAYNITTTTIGKADIVNKAEKLQNFMKNTSNYKVEQVEIVSKLLCKHISGTSDPYPLNSYTTTTTATTTYPITSTEAVTTEVATTKTPTEVITNVAKTTEAITTIPIETTVITTPATDFDECKMRADNIFFKLYEFAPNYYVGNVQLNRLHSDFRLAIKTDLNDINDYRCGSGFFKLEGETNNQKISFDSQNDFVKSAIIDVTCQKAALATFPLLEDMEYHDLENNWKYNYYHSAYVYNYVEPAVNIASGKNCGAGWFEVTYPTAKKSRITYTISNPNYSKALVKYKKMKQCQQAANQVVKLIHSQFGYMERNYHVVVMADSLGFKRYLRSVAQVGEQNNCGTDFFTVQGQQSQITVTYQNTNPYMSQAWREVKKNNNCTIAARDVFTHLRLIGVYSMDDEASFVIPNYNDDIRQLLDKSKVATGLDCGEGFLNININENKKFELSYNATNEYIFVEKMKMTTSEICKLTARGVIIRLCEVELYKLNGPSVTITRRNALREELKEKLYVSNTLELCGDDFFTYSEGRSGNDLTIGYVSTNKYIQSMARGIEKDIFCQAKADRIVVILKRMKLTSEDASKEFRHFDGNNHARNRNQLAEMEDLIQDRDCVSGGKYFLITQANVVWFKLNWDVNNKYVKAAWEKIER